VWVSHDADYLYFAFQCDDPDPSSIKTSVTRRDNIWQDDWIGLSLDALGSSAQIFRWLSIEGNVSAGRAGSTI
jgi:hypothetical protein